MEPLDDDEEKTLHKWTDYQALEKIGYGAYSTVWEGIHVPTGTHVAIKKQKDIFSNLTNCKRILREVRLLRQFDHPSIIKIYDVFPDKEKPQFTSVYIIMELADASLREAITSVLYFTDSQIKRVFYNLIIGLKYLKSAGVLHRDIKPENILLYENCDVKICDFGLARAATEISCPLSLHKIKRRAIMETKKKESKVATKVKKSIKEDNPANNLKIKAVKKKPTKRKLSDHVVTRWYRAPEIILMQKDYGYAIDMWSAGCVLAELQGMKKENLSNPQDRQPLFPGTSCYPLSPAANEEEEEGDQLNMIFDILGSPPNEEDMSFVEGEELIKILLGMEPKPKIDISNIYPATAKEAIDIMERMLTFSPYKRLTMNECLSHPYFKDVRKKEKEIISTEHMVLEFDNEEKLDQKKLRELFKMEFEYFKNKIKAGTLFAE